MYLSVCLSDSAHAVIGRQPSRDVTSSIVYKATEGGGTTDCRHCTTTTGSLNAAGRLNFRGQYEITRNTN